MTREITLTPEELFYLGKILNAAYIDYAYIAAMKDIQMKKEVAAQDIRLSLTAKNYLMEDFSGEVEIDEAVKHLLSPIFFGEFESMVSVCIIQEKSYVNSVRIHTGKDATVMVLMLEDGLHISLVEDNDIRHLVYSLMPDGYADISIPDSPSIDRKKITRVIACKNALVGRDATVTVFFECDGLMCKDAGNVIEVLHCANFCTEVFNILKGADYGLS